MVNVYSLNKDGGVKLTANFSVKEFKCHDGSDPIFIDPLLPMVLQAIRSQVNKKIHVLSGYRTPQHNSKNKGAEFSQHLYGSAADIYADGMTTAELASVAEGIMPTWGGIGVYAKSGFVHVDVRPDKSRWSE